MESFVDLLHKLGINIWYLGQIKEVFMTKKIPHLTELTEWIALVRAFRKYVR